jgi:hypothetical protein
VKVYSCVLSHEYSDNMTKLRTFAAVVGCILSAYAVYVEYKVASIHAHKATTIVPSDETTEAPFLKEVEEEPEFVALCDIKSIGASYFTRRTDVVLFWYRTRTFRVGFTQCRIRVHPLHVFIDIASADAQIDYLLYDTDGVCVHRISSVPANIRFV